MVSSLPEGDVSVTGSIVSLIEPRSMVQSLAAARGLERLLLEVRLLHQPVGEPAQQLGVRAAALDSRAPTARSGRTGAAPRGPCRARPSTSSGLSSAPFISDLAVARVGIDQAEPASPVGGSRACRRPASRRSPGGVSPSSVSFGLNGSSITRPVGTGRQDLAERRAVEAERRGEVGARRDRAARRRART